ncbi:MAG: FAD-dependent oxidoreductase, partial [Flavobacterium sp.]
IEEYQLNVLYKNKHLKTVFENSTLLFDKPITISQISFDKKHPVENHILMIGDTAGLIHPLCGNGMAMAIHSAKIASELILDYYSDKKISRALLEKNYTQQWNIHFGKRLFMGRILAKILTHKTITNVLFAVVASFPGILPGIIKQTHGKPIAIN